MAVTPAMVAPSRPARRGPIPATGRSVRPADLGDRADSAARRSAEPGTGTTSEASRARSAGQTGSARCGESPLSRRRSCRTGGGYRCARVRHDHPCADVETRDLDRLRPDRCDRDLFACDRAAGQDRDDRSATGRCSGHSRWNRLRALRIRLSCRSIRPSYRCCPSRMSSLRPPVLLRVPSELLLRPAEPSER